MSWTPERTALVTKLWLEGLTAAQVATQLRGATRNMVIAKVHRLGLKRDLPAKPPARAKTDTRVIVPPKVASSLAKGAMAQRVHSAMVSEALKAAPPVPTPAAVRRAEVAPTATLITLAAHGCRWPIGNPGADGFGFCGRTATRKSYCEDHARRAFQPMPAPLKVGNLPGWAR